MTDVYLAYARNQRDGVQQLANALTEYDCEIIVDPERDLQSTRWLHRAYREIEGADTFVVMLGYESLTSDMVQYEILHARRQHKRIVPIIRKRIYKDNEEKMRNFWHFMPWNDVALENWEALRRIEWLSWPDEPGAFEAVVETLRARMAVDAGYVQQHTHYQVNALGWERGGGAYGDLLLGEDLDRAEQWLDGARGRSAQPAPTDMQVRYIEDSRARADELARQLAQLSRQERALRGAAASLAIAAFVALAAFTAALFELL